MSHFSRWFAAVALMGLASVAGAASTGSITGRIVDADANLPLPGATIVIDGTEQGTISDRDGNFRLSGVPTGRCEVMVTYIGYKAASQSFHVKSGAPATASFRLEPGVITTDEILVVGERLQGQARAINQQKTNLNITNIVAADQIGRFPDANIGDAMKRIPGIVVEYDQGEARFGLIRGTEARMNSVMLNGERVPSAEGEIRAVQLDLIPSDMIQTVEVHKALTPDMDADAIGGAVNLVTRSAPAGLRISGTLGSGYNFLSEEPMGISSLVVGNRFLDGQLGVLLSASYHNHHLGSDDLEPEWDEDDGQAFVEELQIREYDVHRIRRSLGASADYRLSDNHRFFLRSLWNHRDDFENRFRLEIKDLSLPESGQTESWEVVRQLKGGTSDNDDARLEDQRATSTTLGGVHHMPRDIELSWSATYAEASEERPGERYLEYVVERDEDDGDSGVAVYADMSDLEKPMFTFVNSADVALGEFKLNELTEEHQFTEETDLNARVDVEIPWLTGTTGNRIVAGLRYRGKDKERDNSFYEYEPIDEDAMATLADVPTRDVTNPDFLAGDYETGIFADESYLGGLDLDNPALFQSEDKPDEYVPGSYDATETITGGYLMLDQSYGEQWSFVAGLRIENTSIDYNGYELLVDAEGDLSTRATSGDESYTHLLPGLHARYQFDRNTVLRAAWTNTIARPNYYDLVPYREVNLEDNELATGNDALDPTTSMNFDLMGERYFHSIGLISTGVFYKIIDDFTFYFVEEDYLDPVSGNTFDEFVQPRNGAGASLMGFEVAVQRQLDFVPALRGLGIYANYTYTDSEIDELPIEGRENDELPLPGTAKHSLNGSLSYERDRVGLRLSVNHSSSHIDAGEGDFSDDPFKDRYYDDATHVDLNGSVRITPQVRLFLEANNLTNQPLRFYQGVEERTMQAEYYDRRFSLGLKFDL